MVDELTNVFNKTADPSREDRPRRTPEAGSTGSHIMSHIENAKGKINGKMLVISEGCNRTTGRRRTMTGLSKDLIGRKFEEYSFTIEAGKIREFCLAIGEGNPIYFDREAARKAGYEGIPIPPTYQTMFQFWGYPHIWEDFQKVGVDVRKLLHMKEEYDYHKPLYAGETITTQPEIIAVKSGKNSVMTCRSQYRNGKGENCIEARMSIIMQSE